MPQNVIHISGRPTRGKFLKNLSMVKGGYNKSRIIAVTNDQLNLEDRLNLALSGHRNFIIEGIGSYEGRANVIVFDNAESLIMTDSNKSIKNELRCFVQQLMELKVVQIWSCPDSKGTSPLPEDLFDFIFRVEPDKKSESLSFTVKLEKNGYLGQEKLLPVHLELEKDEKGLVTIIDKGLRMNDQFVAIWHAVNGKTQAQIGEFLEKDQSTISLWLQKAKNDGLINRHGNSYSLTSKGRKALSPLNNA
jgi:hypothetical protein